MDNKELVHNIYTQLSDSRFLRTRDYKKGEIITNYIINRNYVYFLINGSANLIRTTRYGYEDLLEKYEQYDFFGDLFRNVTVNNEMSVIARSKCTVFSFDFDLVKNNPDYLNLMQLLLEVATNRIKKMNKHIEILSGKTIRDKLLIYFNLNVKNRMSKTLELDMSYTELAAYLNVDRASMMRELNQLSKENFIKKDKKRIELLY